MKGFWTIPAAVFALMTGSCSDSGADEPFAVPAPEIVPAQKTIFVAPEGQTGRILYSIGNPVDGAGVAVTVAEADRWVHSFDGSLEGEIAFTADPNDGQTRLAVVTLSYPGAEPATVAVVQNGMAVPPLTFRIEVVEKSCDSAVVTWTPSNDDDSYLAMVVEKSLYDSYASDEAYIAGDLEYIGRQAALRGESFETTLSTFLIRGPVDAEHGRVSYLSPDTDYYAYAYGMTLDGEATSAIAKVAFRTDPFSCSFALQAGTTDSQAVVSVVPSTTACYYFWDLVPAADFAAWGDDAGVIAASAERIRQAVELARGEGHTDVDCTYFLSVGPTEQTCDGLVPDSEYVLFAFACDEEVRALDGLSKCPVKTEPFAATDDCRFAIGFSNVAPSGFTIEVVPTGDATRYYVGLCTSERFAADSPDAIAAAFIAMENRYGIDWAGDRYIFTGRQRIDTFYGLMMGSLDASTDYTVVVFGVDAGGKRTTEVAHAGQRTADLTPSAMTIRMEVSDITWDGATVDFHPSDQEETYYADCIPYADFEAYGSDAACVQALVESAGAYIDYYLLRGSRQLDCHGYLDPATRYIAVAFGYASGVTTPLFRSEPFTTGELRTDGRATVDISVTVADGDDYYAADPVKYAAYAGKALLYGAVTHSADAAKWYVGGFSADISDSTDAEVTAYLLAKGYESRDAVAFLAEWGGQMTFAGVALDREGAAGKLFRSVVTAERSRTELNGIRSARAAVVRAEVSAPFDRPVRRGVLPAEHAVPCCGAQGPLQPRVALGPAAAHRLRRGLSSAFALQAECAVHGSRVRRR